MDHANPTKHFFSSTTGNDLRVNCKSAEISIQKRQFAVPDLMFYQESNHSSMKMLPQINVHFCYRVHYVTDVALSPWKVNGNQNNSNEVNMS